MQIFFPWNHIYLAAEEQGEKVLFLPGFFMKQLKSCAAILPVASKL